MTVKNEKIILWDSGKDQLCLLAVSPDNQYKYTDGLPCITVGVTYENSLFKGYDVFTFFDHFYVDLLRDIADVYERLDGKFRLYDIGADTDGYIDCEMNNGELQVKGRLGATISSHSLTFDFTADQTLLVPLMRSLAI